jgi:hypothetical protein
MLRLGQHRPSNIVPTTCATPHKTTGSNRSGMATDKSSLALTSQLGKSLRVTRIVPLAPTALAHRGGGVLVAVRNILSDSTCTLGNVIDRCINRHQPTAVEGRRVAWYRGFPASPRLGSVTLGLVLRGGYTHQSVLAHRATSFRTSVSKDRGTRNVGCSERRLT